MTDKCSFARDALAAHKGWAWRGGITPLEFEQFYLAHVGGCCA
jgi:hypothetical protein